MISRYPGRHARIVAAGFLALALLLAGLFLSELIWRYNWANTTLDSIEPRFARLTGIEAVGEELISRHARAASDLTRYAYPADVDVGRAGTDLQQRVRSLADEYGINVSGTQILPPREEAGLLLVGVTGAMAGDIGSVGRFLLRLETEQPLVIVEKMLAQAPSSRRRGQVEGMLTFQFTFSAVRLLP